MKRLFIFLGVAVAVALTATFAFFLLNKDTRELPGNYPVEENLIDGDFSGNLETAEDKNEEEISMLFFGDLMLDRHVGDIIKTRGLAHLFEKIATGTDNIFLNKDLIGVNLEGAVTDGGAHYPPANIYDFAFHPEVIRELKDYNFSFFTLANNHFADQGERGIIETRKNLDELGYFYVGCKDREVDDCSLSSFDIRGKKIGMAAFSMVYGLLNTEEKALRKISELREDNDLVIVNIHWGREYEHFQNQTQKNFGRKMAEAGADIIIGHHPHVVQGMEIYSAEDGRLVPIFYSLGNFIFDQYFSAATQEGLAVLLKFTSDKTISFDLLPHKSVKSQAMLMDDDEKNNFFKKFISWSALDDEIKNDIINNKKIILHGRN